MRSFECTLSLKRIFESKKFNLPLHIPSHHYTFAKYGASYFDGFLGRPKFTNILDFLLGFILIFI